MYVCVDVRYVDVLVCGCTCVDVCVRGCVCVWMSAYDN